MRRVHAALGAVLLAACSLAGCGPEPGAGEAPPAPAPPPRPRSLVLVLVDTLRADHLSTYGYGRPTSPNLDAFAASGVLFEKAWSQATCTFPSANSILTSRYPAAFQGQPEGRMGIPEGIPSLAEILQARGYRTVALSASPIVRKSPSRFNPHGGFERGFDFFGEGCVWQDAGCLNQQVERQLPQLPRPFFLYLHYMDPHGPYRPPEGQPRRFAGDYNGRHEFIRLGDPNPISKMIYEGGARLEITPGDVTHLVGLYDDEIAYFDQRFPELLAMLEAAGVGDETVVALISDHGEEFLEHGHIKHCRAPYDTLVQIPLMVRVPGGPAGVRVKTPVESIDLVPTLLDYLGEEPSSDASDASDASGSFDGRSLRPWMEGRAPVRAPGRYLYSSQWTWKAVTDGRFKLMTRLGEPHELQLFDLAGDPGELRDVQQQRPDELRRLRRALFDWLQRTEGDEEAGVAAAEESQRRLKALGYIQ